MHTIANTIAQLLSFLTNDAIYNHIVSDLINLLTDCVTIIEGDMLPANLIILEETLQYCEVDDKYMQKIETVQEAWMLQTVTLTILSVFLTTIKSKRLETSTDAVSEDLIDGERSLPPGAIDIVYTPNFVDNASLRLILSVVRHMLFSKRSSNLSAYFSMQLKLSAIRVLNQLFLDWNTCSVQLTAQTEASILVIRATQQYLDSNDISFIEFEGLLITLLHSSLIRPTQAQGANGCQEGLSYVRTTTLPALLRCVGPIATRKEHGRTSLDKSVFRVLHNVLHTTDAPDLVGYAMTYCIANGILPSLFSCLEDPNLCNFAIGVLGALLLSGDEGRGIEELGRISQSARIAFDTMDTANDDCENKGETIATEPSVGRKRKRTSPRKKKPIPLQPLEMSPSVLPRGNRIPPAGNVVRPDLSFWDEDVNSFLQRALSAGRRLEKLYAQDEKRYDTVSIKDPLLVSAGLRLIMDNMRRNAGWSGSTGLSSCSAVANFLLTSLRTCCSELAKGGEVELSQFDFPLAEVVIDTGIYLHFTMQSLSAVLDSTLRETLRATLDSFSRLGLQLAVAIFATPSFRSSIGRCRCSLGDIFYPLGLSGLPSSDGSGACSRESTSVAPLCTCSLIADSRVGRPADPKASTSSTMFAFDCALMVFDLLPFRSRLVWSRLTSYAIKYPDDSPPPLFDLRCYLLASIRNGAEVVSDAPNSNTHAMDVILSFIKEASSSLPRIGDERSLQCAISLVPVLLLTQTKVGTVNSTSTRDFKQNFEVLMTKLLKEVLLPIVKRVDANADAIVETLLWTLNHLKMMHSQIDYDRHNESFLHPAGVVDLFFGAVDVTVGDDAAAVEDISDDPLWLLRQTMFVAAQKVEESHRLPSIRTLRWACMANASVGCPSISIRRLALGEKKKGTRRDVDSGSLWLFWLLSAPFSESDPSTRRFMAEKLNKVLMHNNYGLLLSLFASTDDVEAFNNYTNSTRLERMVFQNASDLTTASDRTVSGLFRAIDSLLLNVCGLADSQLSFTMSRSEHDGTQQRAQQASGGTALLQRSAVNILGSLCVNADLGDPVGVWFFEKALIRLIRMWAATPVEKVAQPLFPEIPSTPACRAMAFGQLARLSTSHSLPTLISQKLSETFAASVFCDILILSASSSREIQYTRLESFILSFVRGSQEGESKRLRSQEVQRFIEEQLPAIVCQFVVEKDNELLRLTAGFKEFLEESSKTLRKKSRVETPVVGHSNAPVRRKIAAFTLSNKELERKTRHLCLQPKMIERILPLVLINSDRSGLVFFLSKVLSGVGISLREIIQNREQLILKELVLHLGSNPSSTGPAVQAIRVAATALLSEASGTKRLATSDDSLARDPSLASQWVTSHFMYLLVNAIQYRWKSRSRREQVHAMSCLSGLLNFLLPKDSAQYFPQIMATVNAASMYSGCSDGRNASDFSDVASLQLHAIKCLSKFVRLVAERQIDTIAMNLTTIVVSLIPVLNDGNMTHWALRSAQDEAISLLEYLTSGPIGKSLSQSFNEIPFLPQLPHLKSVHDALRSNNVDFDNLVVLSSGTQHGDSSRRESMTSDGSLTIASKSTISSRRLEKLAGLQKRLHTMTMLLDSENTSVRNAVLKHLTDLLRFNRDLFHVLIENEGSVSTNFVTVIYAVHTAQGMDQGGTNCEFNACEDPYHI